MERPFGVTVLAILSFLGAVFCVVVATLFVLAMGIAGFGPKQPGLAPFFHWGAVYAVTLLVLAVLVALTGLGMWKLRRWARIITIIFAFLNLQLQLLGLMGALLYSKFLAFALGLVFLALYAWTLWYMFQLHVKKAFGIE